MIKVGKETLFVIEYLEETQFPPKSLDEIEKEVSDVQWQVKNGFMSKNRSKKVLAKLQKQKENLS